MPAPACPLRDCELAPGAPGRPSSGAAGGGGECGRAAGRLPAFRAMEARSEGSSGKHCRQVQGASQGALPCFICSSREPARELRSIPGPSREQWRKLQGRGQGVPDSIAGEYMEMASYFLVYAISLSILTLGLSPHLSTYFHAAPGMSYYLTICHGRWLYCWLSKGQPLLQSNWFGEVWY